MILVGDMQVAGARLIPESKGKKGRRRGCVYIPCRWLWPHPRLENLHLEQHRFGGPIPHLTSTLKTFVLCLAQDSTFPDQIWLRLSCSLLMKRLYTKHASKLRPTSEDRSEVSTCKDAPPPSTKEQIRKEEAKSSGKALD